MRALNVPGALSSAVEAGVAGVTGELRAYLPKRIKPADEAYKERLRKALEAHGPQKPGDFDRFVEAQLVWDEGMAEAAAVYLNRHPQIRMVILAGSGHLEFGSGIPMRVKRRTNATTAIVINSEDGVAAPHMADYLVLSPKVNLPPLEVGREALEQQNEGCVIRSVTSGGAAAKAGLKKRAKF